MIRTILFWDLYWGPIILGNYHGSYSKSPCSCAWIIVLSGPQSTYVETFSGLEPAPARYLHGPFGSIRMWVMFWENAI